MGQMGFFDIANRYAGLDAKNDPLARIDAVVPWENFRARLEAIWRKPAEERKSPAGRKPWDAVAMFKAIVLCELYNLSDDQVEYQLRDRLSFMRFVGFGLEDKVPDAKTVWLYREQLARAGMVEALFEDFDGYLEKQGYLAMGGQIIDASIVPQAAQQPSGWRDAGGLTTGARCGKSVLQRSGGVRRVEGCFFISFKSRGGLFLHQLQIRHRSRGLGRLDGRLGITLPSIEEYPRTSLAWSRMRVGGWDVSEQTRISSTRDLHTTHNTHQISLLLKISSPTDIVAARALI